MFRFERDALRLPAANAFTRERPIRFQDVDAAGIIFYPRALELCHDVYVEFLAEVGFPLHESLAGDWLAPIRHAEADYLRPLRFGDHVEIAIVAAHLGPAAPPSEVTLGYRITSLSDGEVAIVAQTVHTFLDRKSFRRTAIPDGLERVLGAFGAGNTSLSMG
jgi:YbgC/YbaW family acyl-CoA thioester hydrolase